MDYLKLILALIFCAIGFFIAYGLGHLFGFDWKWVFVVYSQFYFVIKVIAHDDD